MRLSLVAVASLVACQQPGTPVTTRPAPLAKLFSIRDLVGTWRWILRTNEAGTSRVEDERWYFRQAGDAPNQLIGRYLREVEVRSTDQPFQCNQHPWYRQRAMFDVTVSFDPSSKDGAGFVVTETGYKTEPGPCDHGFRHVGVYTGELVGNRFALRWDGGTQTLWQIDGPSEDALPEMPWQDKPALFGAWRWDTTSYDDDNNLRDESEWWEITRRSETRLDATYRRRVTVRSVDGKPITCAGAPSWRFDDAYILDGQREEEHWRFNEVAVEPGDHPCLRATPRRTLDEATAEQLGDYLTLEWRGKRRQILHRPE